MIEKAHGRDIISLAFTPDGTGLLSRGYRSERGEGRISELYLWNVADGSKIHEFQLPLERLGGGASLVLSADGSTLVTLHNDWLIAWDMRSREAIRVIPRNDRVYRGTRSHGVAISPDNRLVASIADQHKVSLWRTDTGEPVFPQPNTHHGGVLSIDTSPDGTLIATSGEEGDVHLWDAVSGQHIRKLFAHTIWVRTVQFLPNGDRVLIAGEFSGQGPGFTGIMKVLQTSNGAVELEWALPDRATCTAVSADGAQIAVALGLGLGRAFGDGNEPEIRVYDLEDGTELAVLKGHEREILQLQFDQDGTTLWSTSDDGTIRKWNPTSGGEMEKIVVQGGGGSLQRLNISSDLRYAVYGNLIYRRAPEVSVAQLAAVALRQEASDWQETSLTHFHMVAEFSPDGRFVALGLRPIGQTGDNHQVALIEADSGKQVLSFELEDGMVRSLASSRDGRTLYSGMDRGDLLVWDVSRAYE